MEHGQAMANLAAFVTETLMVMGALDSEAFDYGIDVANALNANPQVLRDLIESPRQTT